MGDKREAILARLVEVCEGIAGITATLRNDINPSEKQLPALIILDADEEADQTATDRNIQGRAANLVHMMPQIGIVLQDKTEDVGASLNALRVLLIKAVLFDSDLLTLVGSNGNIRYQGCETELGIGRSMQGNMNVRFRFTYVLKPTEL